VIFFSSRSVSSSTCPERTTTARQAETTGVCPVEEHLHQLRLPVLVQLDGSSASP